MNFKSVRLTAIVRNSVWELDRSSTFIGSCCVSGIGEDEGVMTDVERMKIRLCNVESDDPYILVSEEISTQLLRDLKTTGTIFKLVIDDPRTEDHGNDSVIAIPLMNLSFEEAKQLIALLETFANDHGATFEGIRSS